MKKALILSMVIIFSFCYATFALASFKRPFGGKITATNIPTNVTCETNENSPFVILPALGDASSWAVGPGMVSFGQITVNAWILGLHSNSECIEIDGVYERPYSVLYSNFYGTSKKMGGGM